MTAFVQFSGFGLSIAAFIYGLAENINGKCVDHGYTFCQVFRITMAFDTLVWYGPPHYDVNPRLLQLAGFILILWETRPAKPQEI